MQFNSYEDICKFCSNLKKKTPTGKSLDTFSLQDLTGHVS